MNSKALYVLIFLAGVFLNSVSQMMLKKSALKSYPSRLREYLNPLVIGSYVMSTGVTFLFTLVYRVLPLSAGPVLESAGYLFVTFWGVVIFHEKLTRKKVLALGLIVAGILIASLC